MKQRVLTAIAFGIIMLAIFYLTYLWPFAFYLVSFLFTAFATLEVRNALSHQKIFMAFWPAFLPSQVYFLNLLIRERPWSPDHQLQWILAMALVGTVLAGVLNFRILLKQGAEAYPQVLAQLLTALSLGIPAAAATSLLMGQRHGLAYLILGFCMPWVCDSAAYLLGSAVGKHPVFPKLSPKKTWEGIIAAVVTGVIVLLLLLLLPPHDALQSIYRRILGALLLGLLLSLACIFGDLAESAFKRWCGIKDSGRLLPGHGGLLDRFDSVFWTMPTLALSLNLFELWGILPW